MFSSLNLDVHYIPYNVNLSLLRISSPTHATSCQRLNNTFSLGSVFLLSIFYPHDFSIYCIVFHLDFILLISIPTLFALLKLQNSIYHSLISVLIDLLLLILKCKEANAIFHLWYISLMLNLSYDIHPNPGPKSHSPHSYTNGYFSFCNWNLNTLCKDNFCRIPLIEAHTALFKYDIISLCETSLNDSNQPEENILPGYKFVSRNNPDGSANSGVRIFFEESLSLRVRNDHLTSAL